METYFASAKRACQETLEQELALLSHNPVIDNVMQTINGLLAVLNENRQILTINNTLLEFLGIDNTADTFGLRLGEVIQCLHANELPNGCGTTEYCVKCGAAIAMVTSLETNHPEEHECVVTVTHNGKDHDLYFHVRAHPITFEGHKFILLFLQDTTVQQRRAALERVFFHDINNLIQALKMNSYLIGYERDPASIHELAHRIQLVTARLAAEVAMQRILASNDDGHYTLMLKPVTLETIYQELHEILDRHPVAENKGLQLQTVSANLTFNTDISLLLRILTNMLINAFEATDAEHTVKLWVEPSKSHLTFYVWNHQPIPPEIRLRIFQRNFSTKAESGRGLGTYAMKLFGETYLKGKVTFTTSEEQGTTFELQLPLET